jgi:hypothetical protein
MRKYQVFLLVFAFLVMPVLSALASYSVVIEDLPLMPGMTELKDRAVIFDKPGGRIVETAASVPAQAREIEKFYAASLPPLGWVPSAQNVYIREGEKLTVAAADRAVQFKITPLAQGK